MQYAKVKNIFRILLDFDQDLLEYIEKWFLIISFN